MITKEGWLFTNAIKVPAIWPHPDESKVLVFLTKDKARVCESITDFVEFVAEEGIWYSVSKDKLNDLKSCIQQ